MKFDIFIQAGQSNAEGSGIGDVLHPYETDERICFLEAEKTVLTTDSGLDIQYADKPFSICLADYHGTDGSIGDFSLSFSRAYIAAGLLAGDRGILIIRAGVGGTGFQRHHWGLDEILYNKMIEMVDYALSLNCENRLMGFLWHQGEHDAFEGNTGENYHFQLTQLLESVKSRYRCPNIPFLCGGFTQDWFHKNETICQPILAALRQTAAEQNGSFIETDGLLSNDQMTGNGDDIHFCRQALHTLGQRYFEAYIRIWEKSKLADYVQLIGRYSAENYLQMTREPTGLLTHPYIVPGSQSYSDCLWDWDSWLTNVALRQIMMDNGTDHDALSAHEKGCILNFLDHTATDGKMPICIMPDRIFPELPEGARVNVHKPCLAQHAAFIVKQEQGNAQWLRGHMPKLRSFIQYYQERLRDPKTGLYFWHDDTAIGVDNDPSVFYRPDDSICAIFLNCLMYKELLAMAYLCEQLSEDGSAYSHEAEKLKNAINRLMWDERNGTYYSVDLNLKPIDTQEYLHSGMPRHWDCVQIRIDSWSGFMAMWAGIATPERAERMVRENMMKPELFNGRWGVCTLAKTEPMYCIVKSGNPSCWLGPVWGISNYICYRGLKNYGFERQAQELAEKTICLFGRDIERNGLLHEYYHPDTGEGVNNPGFQNWNLLVNNMIAEQLEQISVREF